MAVIEITTTEDRITPRQRWGHYFVLVFGALSLFIGMNLRDNALNALTLYVNTQAGIQASYPRGWLIDSAGDYVFRVRDVSDIGFKTAILITVLPVGPDASAWSILTSQTLNRAQTLAAYTVTLIEPYTLPDESEGTTMHYTYVVSDPNPFLDSVPVAVRGSDLLVIKRGQAIIITFLVDSRLYEQKIAVFNQFLSNLEF